VILCIFQRCYAMNIYCRPWSFIRGFESSTFRYFMTFIVKSALNHENRRKLIRETWGSIKGVNGQAYVDSIFLKVNASLYSNHITLLSLSIVVFSVVTVVETKSYPMESFCFKQMHNLRQIITFFLGVGCMHGCD